MKKVHTPVRGIYVELEVTNEVEDSKLSDFKYPITIGGVESEDESWGLLFHTSPTFAVTQKYHKSDCVIGYLVSTPSGLLLQEDAPESGTWTRQVYLTQENINQLGYVNVSNKLRDLAWKLVIGSEHAFSLDNYGLTRATVKGNGKISSSRWMPAPKVEAWLQVKHGLFGVIKP